ncbi:hypothetical protein B0J13DRAFT_320596 [Dactylonectria estremocensis]|uniref:Uncharacterized protein n=1 Tax=Dactylonectria estremocensis TaxID=1079267 RepID=A0A9P9I5X0_9HYPO|nr:hypothetical protein B0J13DRAFT_320596 [Dactylonectria estremocensis]
MNLHQTLWVQQQPLGHLEEWSQIVEDFIQKSSKRRLDDMFNAFSFELVILSTLIAPTIATRLVLVVDQLSYQRYLVNQSAPTTRPGQGPRLVNLHASEPKYVYNLERSHRSHVSGYFVNLIVLGVVRIMELPSIAGSPAIVLVVVCSLGIVCN